MKKIRAALLVLLALVIAVLWMLPAILADGLNLLESTKLKLRQESSVKMRSIAGVLRRRADLSEHTEMLALYATPEFFASIRKEERNARFSPEKSLIFIINEDTHEGTLGRDPTPAVLRVDGRKTYKPEKAETVSYSDHHKISILSFPKNDSAGRPIMGPDARFLELVAPKAEESSFVVLRWDLPIIYPEEVLRGERMPFATMLALTMGLMATVLIPCFLQMVLYYFSLLTGFSAEMVSGKNLDSKAKSYIIKLALSFIAGFMILLTGVGALAGLAGDTFQSSVWWQTWTRPLSVAAGAVIILLGIWTAIRARSPLVCRLPMAGFVQKKEAGFFRTALAGFSFVLGCSTCFGGALIATLLFYVGTLGSATEGMLIMFLFSLGVGIPFFLAAVLFSRAVPLLSGMQKAAPFIGIVSCLVMILFGILLITDNFHLVSAWIHEWIDWMIV